MYFHESLYAKKNIYIGQASHHVIHIKSAKVNWAVILVLFFVCLRVLVLVYVFVCWSVCVCIYVGVSLSVCVSLVCVKAGDLMHVKSSPKYRIWFDIWHLSWFMYFSLNSCLFWEVYFCCCCCYCCFDTGACCAGFVCVIMICVFSGRSMMQMQTDSA